MRKDRRRTCARRVTPHLPWCCMTRFCASQGAEASNLKSLCRASGDVTLEGIRPDHIEVYLAGKEPITATWEVKYSALKGFYRFAVARGYVKCVPVPPAVFRPPRNIRFLHAAPERYNYHCRAIGWLSHCQLNKHRIRPAESAQNSSRPEKEPPPDARRVQRHSISEPCF